MVGANGGSSIIFKVVPRPPEMLKQVVLAHVAPLVMRFDPGPSQNALKMGRFGTKNGFEKRQTGVFQK